MNNEIVVLFDFNESKEDISSGSCSSISWDSLKPYLDSAFYTRPNERIVGIAITQDGIKAKFKSK